MNRLQERRLPTVNGYVKASTNAWRMLSGHQKRPIDRQADRQIVDR